MIMRTSTHSRLRIGSNSFFFRDLKTLFVQRKIWDLHRLSESKVHFYLKRVEYETEEMVGIVKGLRLYNPLSSKEGERSCRCFKL